MPVVTLKLQFRAALYGAPQAEPIHKLVKVCMELEGYTVLTADGAESAMKLYRQHRSAVCAVANRRSDAKRQRLELADRVLQLEPQLKTLFRSATDGASRGFGCMRKPFTQAELIGRVGEVCRR